MHISVYLPKQSLRSKIQTALQKHPRYEQMQVTVFQSPESLTQSHTRTDLLILPLFSENQDTKALAQSIQRFPRSLVVIFIYPKSLPPDKSSHSQDFALTIFLNDHFSTWQFQKALHLSLSWYQQYHQWLSIHDQYTLFAFSTNVVVYVEGAWLKNGVTLYDHFMRSDKGHTLNLRPINIWTTLHQLPLVRCNKNCWIALPAIVKLDESFLILQSYKGLHKLPVDSQYTSSIKRHLEKYKRQTLRIL